MLRRLYFVFLLLLSGAMHAAVAVELVANHPTQHVVVKGDTLWDISGRFLQNPWEWPKIWHANSQIKNPHLIYPGDVITLVYRDGQPMLELSRGHGSTSAKLSPSVREIQLANAISTVPFDAISPFLSRPEIVGAEILPAAPYVVANADDRVLSASGDIVYVRSLDEDAMANYSVFRPGKEYRDYETNEILGYEALYSGSAEVLEIGDPATLELNNTRREVVVGDRLLPLSDEGYNVNFFPKHLQEELDGHIISVPGGVSQVGQYTVVAIDRGSNDYLEVGHLLSVYKSGKTIRDEVTEQRGDVVTLPDEYAGVAMVFKVFEGISYAILMEAKVSVEVGDKVIGLEYDE